MYFDIVKRYYDMGHPAYNNDSLKNFVKAKMITPDQYKDITQIEYAAA